MAPRTTSPRRLANANKRGRARLREELAALTSRRRALSPVLRVSTTCESPSRTLQHVTPSLGQLESGDTPQGKRSKVTPTPMTAVVCQEAQRSLQKWKQQGLQLLNYYDQCVNTHEPMVRNAWSATVTAHFRKRRHGWITWGNEEHGMQIYRFKKQADF